jgi:hypothetical protein
MPIKGSSGFQPEFCPLTQYNGIKMVVSQHPQGKPEEPHVNEILKAFSV